MRILVTGAGGMLGREVWQAAADAGHEVHPWVRRFLDVANADHVVPMIRETRADVVINCAGLTKHRDPEPTPDEYRHVNTYGPLLLARECDRAGSRLIHVSTDCVFAGTRPLDAGPYTEDDLPDAEDDYGRSKADGEVVGPPHLTVRTSFVGLGERGLIAWLRERSASAIEDDHRIEGWDQAYWSGSTAPAVARAIVELAQRSGVVGLMHLTDGSMWSKAELCSLIIDKLRLPLTVDYYEEPNPPVNRWLDTKRDDVPALPPLAEALRKLAG